MSCLEKRIFYALISFLFVLVLVQYINDFSDLKILNWDNQVPFYFRVSKPTSVFLQSEIKRVLGKDFLVLGKVSGSRLRVYLNDSEIYEIGGETGNLWTRPIIVKLPKTENNFDILKIEVFGVYDVGIHYVPFLTDSKNANLYYTLVSFFRDGFFLFAIGASLILGIVLLISASRLGGLIDKSILYLGISSIISAVGMLDYTFRTYSGNLVTYLIIEKFLTTLFPISFVFIVRSIEEYCYVLKSNKLVKYLGIFSAVLMILSPTFHWYNRFLSLIQLVVLVQLFYIAYIIFKSKAKLFYFSVSFLIFSVVQTVIVLAMKWHGELLLAYGSVVFRFGVSFALLERLKEISFKAKHFEHKSSIDPLTNAYNRNILERIQLKGYLILLDLNGFKKINDTYGHTKGDEILVMFSNLLKFSLREDDFLIRIGGDEFCIITNSENPDSIADRLRKISNEQLQIDFSYGIAKLEGDFDRAYREADEKMYKNKLKIKLSREDVKNESFDSDTSV